MSTVEVVFGSLILSAGSFYMGARYGVHKTFQWLARNIQAQSQKKENLQ